TPTRARTVSHSAAVHSAASRKPWRNPGTASQGAWVSTVRLAARGGLRYLAPRETRRRGGTQSARPAGRPRAARAPRLPGADRLASPAGRTARRRSRLDALQPHVGVAQQLVERVPLVLVLVEDAADARVDEHLQAVNAGGVRDVDVGVADAGSWVELGGFGQEGEHEYTEGGECGESASRVERPPVVVGGRVTEREEDGDDDCPQEPARISADTEPDEEGDQQRGDPRSG